MRTMEGGGESERQTEKVLWENRFKIKVKEMYIHKLKNKQTKRNLLLWINKKFDITECRCCGERRGGASHG